jgi:hypothetical protein
MIRHHTKTLRKLENISSSEADLKGFQASFQSIDLNYVYNSVLLNFQGVIIFPKNARGEQGGGGGIL